MTQGALSILITLDKDLESMKDFDKKMNFEIKPDEQVFLINLQVKSTEQGLHYIRLLTKID